MYDTSNAYRTAINGKLQKSRIEIVITPTSGTSFTVTDANIIPKSVSYSNKASKNSEFSFGSAYVGEFKFTMLNVYDVIDRYTLYGAEVIPTVYVTLPDDSEESIPIGRFYIDEPKRSKKTIVVTSYDAMTRFDVPQIVDTFGTPYQLLELLCTTCSVPFGMTEAQVESMINGTEQLTMSAERVKTCRDAISYISTVLCGFATINRSGELEIREYAATTTASIDADKRISSTIDDYTTYFIGMKARFLQNGNWVKVSANVQGATSGLILDMGDVPMVQGATPTLKVIAQRIANRLGQVNFTPSEVSIVGDATYDLGDLIEYEHANNSTDSVYTPVTSITWKHHGETTLKGEGGNARLNAVTDYQTKQIATVETDAAVNEYAMKVYTNSDAITLSSQDKTIVSLNYSVNKDTVTAFACSVPVTLDKDGDVVLTYMMNNEEVGEYKQYVSRGNATITTVNYFENEANQQNRILVLAHCEYVESDTRKQDAKLGGLIEFTETGTYIEKPIDTSVPGGVIGQKGIRAFLFASGINTTEAWDGNLLIIDNVGAIPIQSHIMVTNLSDVVGFETRETEKENILETVGVVVIPKHPVSIVNLEDAPIIGRKTVTLTIEPSRAHEYTFNTTFINVSDISFGIRTDFTFVGVDTDIDMGYLTSTTIPIDGYDTIDRIEVYDD